jgi:hypothetical protein
VNENLRADVSSNGDILLETSIHHEHSLLSDVGPTPVPSFGLHVLVVGEESALGIWANSRGELVVTSGADDRIH